MDRCPARRYRLIGLGGVFVGVFWATVLRRVAGDRPRASRLTEREQQVLQLLAGGLSQRDIADMLVISPRTAGKHIERILEKLEVRSRAQAVAVAYRDDLVAAR